MACTAMRQDAQTLGGIPRKSAFTVVATSSRKNDMTSCAAMNVQWLSEARLPSPAHWQQCAPLASLTQAEENEMKIVINIETDNAAFDDPNEVGRITRDAIYRCDIGETRPLLDLNGNDRLHPV